MKRNKIIIVILAIAFITVGVIGGLSYFKSKAKGIKPQTVTQGAVAYWTCGMHPSVRVTDKEYKKGKKNCPICNMPLTPVYEEGKLQAEEKEEGVYYGCGIKEQGHCPKCDEGKPDAKCICGEHSFMIKDKKINCPVCGRELVPIEKKDLPATVRERKAGERKILYYRNPMNPSLTSSVPMKDSMGMDYIPVYEEEQERQKVEGIVSTVTLKGTQLELAGVKTSVVKKQHLVKQIRTVGKIAFDPELTVAQEEFLTAVETRKKIAESPDPEVIKRAEDLLEKSKFKLRLLGMSDDEIADLEKQGEAQLHLVLPEDKAWVYADVYEYELSWIKIGQEVKITTTAYPGEEFKGIIKSISPVINPMTRSATVRIEADNIEKKLRPQMYVDVIIESMFIGEDGSDEVLAIPRDAVLDTGTRKIVYVDKGSGEFLGKEVKTGPEVVATIEGENIRMYPVIDGLKEGELVVTKANFLIDSQSQLSGAAAAAYGGALETKEEKAKPALHQH